MNSHPPLVSHQKLSGFCRLAALAVFFLAACAPQLATAQSTITWGPATTVSADTDVTNAGTALYAYADNSATVNGVAFTQVNGNGTAWGTGVTFTTFGGYYGAYYGPPSYGTFYTLSGGYQTILSGGAYYNGGTATTLSGTVTLNNLTVGHDYMVQIWVNDSRTNGATPSYGRTMTITGTGTTLQLNTAGSSGGVGQYSIGTFAASSTTQSFGLTSSSGGQAQLNAISVRDLGTATKTWTGGGGPGTYWGTAANWNPAVAPINPGDSVSFNASSTANLATVLDTSYNIAQLTLNGVTAPVSIGPDGQTLTIQGGINLLGANQRLTNSDALVLSASQAWNVASGNYLQLDTAAVSGSAGLTITGGGTVDFQYAETYTGNITVSAGTLALSGSGSLASSKIIMAGGATFNVSAASSPTYSGTVTNTSNGAVLNGSITYGGTTPFSMLYDGVNPPFIQTNGTLTLSGGTININNTGAVLTNGTYTIITAAQLGTPGAVGGTLPSVNLTGNGAVGAVSLQLDGNNDLQLVVVAADEWTGASDNSWANSGNWNPANVPNPLDWIVFDIGSTQNLTTVLNQDFVTTGLTILNPSGPVTIGGGNNLEIGTGGINMQSASRDLTITAPLTVPNSANWNVAAGRNLNISGGVTSASSSGPTIVGPGSVNIYSPMANQGTMTVSSGSTLKMTTPNVLSTANASTLSVNGVLDLNGNSEAIDSLSGNGIVNNTAVGAVALTIGAGGDGSTNNGVIENTGGALALVVAGGNVVLATTNTYSGGTTFNGGQLYFNSVSSSLGSGPVTFNPGSGVAVYGLTFTNALFLTDCLLRCGGNNFNQIWSGPISVTNGFVMSGDNPNCQMFLSGPINIGTGGISVTNQGNEGTTMGYGVGNYGNCLQGTISGSGGITYCLNGGNSRLTVQGANTYVGGTTVNNIGSGNGKLSVWGGINPFSTGPVTNNGAIIEAAPGNGTVTNSLYLAGTLESEAQYNNYNQLFWTGPITLTADSSFVQFAVAPLNNNQSSGVNVSGPLNINGFTLTCSSAAVQCYGGNTISGQITGTGNINQNGYNALTISGSNTFSGTVRSMASSGGFGTLSIGNVYALQYATLDMDPADAGSVSLNNLNCIIGALVGTRNLSLGSGNVSIGTNGVGTDEYDGVLSGTSGGTSLTKIGTDTLYLTGVNTYTGNTTVSGGTLSISQPYLALSSTVSVSNGAVLNLTFNATNKVSALVLNGISKTNGVYNSANANPYITGSGAIQVGVGVAPVTWTGASNTTWSTTAMLAPYNWKSNSIAGNYADGSYVQFDDSLKSNNVVNISVANVSPSEVIFNNNNTNYTLQASVYGIAGTCALIKNGAGTVTLNNTNFYTGNTIINSNKLTIGVSGKLGNGSYAGAIYLGSGATLEYTNGTASPTFSGPITGPGNLTFDGTGNQSAALTSAGNTYSGITTLANGIRLSVTSLSYDSPNTTFNISNGGQLFLNGVTSGTIPNNFSISGNGYADTTPIGAIRCSGNCSFTGTITLAGNARIGMFGTAVNTFSGQITGSYSPEFAGIMNGNNLTATWVLANTGTANNYTGNTSISAYNYANGAQSGTVTGVASILQLGASGQIPSGNGYGIVALNGGDVNHLTILEMNGFNQTIDGVSNVASTGAMIRNTTTGTSTLTIGAGNTNSTFSGLITDGGAGSGKYLALTKTGTGTVTLTGLNNYQGNTTVSAGTLAIGQATLAVGSTVTVAGGAVLQLNFAGANPVAALVLNGVTKPAGIYNSGNSGGLITGTGSIVVGASTWTGGFSSQWSTATISSPKNWQVSGTAADYADGNDVLFDDTLTGTSLVSLSAANVTPAGVTINNSKTNYVLQGNYGIAGSAALTKNGTAMFAIQTTNSYTGGTLANGGTLEVDANSALGTALVTMNGAVLSNSVSATLTNVLNLNVATTIGVRSGQTLTLGGPITNINALTVTGAGTVVLNATNTYSGGTTISGGTLKFSGPSSSSIPTGSAIVVGNGGTIDLAGLSQADTGLVSLQNGSTLQNGTLTCNNASVAGNNQFNGTITMGTGGAFISNQRLLMANGGVDSLTLLGPGAMTFGGDNNANENYVGVGGGNAALTLSSTLNFNNASTGTGNGYLNVGANAAGSIGIVAINGGNLNVGTWMKLGGIYNTIAGLSSVSSLTVASGAVTIGGGSDPAFNGVLFMDGGNGDNTANTGMSTLTLNSGGTLTVNQFQVGNAGTKTINLNGGTIVAGINASNLFMPATSALTVNLQSGGGTINSGANSITVGSLLGGTGGLTKTGSGMLTLTNVNTYYGNTIISAGELVGGTGGASGNSPVDVNSGATNGVQLLSANTGWFCHALIYNPGATYADFNFNGLAPSTTTAPLIIGPGGLISFNGTTTVIIRNLFGVANGVYPLMDYSNGGLSGAPPTTFTSTCVSGFVSNDVLTATIYLVVTNGAGNYGNPLVWSASSANWDAGISANWKTTGGTPSQLYYDPTAVIFDDTASGSSPILVNNTVTVSPGSVTANLTNKNYTISGSAIAGTAALTKNGTGTLTLSGTNTYTGGTTVNAGSLNLSGANIGTGATTINGGTLNLTGQDANSSVMLTTNGVINESASGVIAGSGVTFTQNSTNTSTLGGMNTYAGGTTVNAGMLVLSGSNTLVGICNVNSGGTLQLQANAANTSGGNSSAFNWTNSYTRLNGNATLQLRSDSSVTFPNNNVNAADVAGTTTNTIDVNCLTSATSNTLSIWPSGLVIGNDGFNVTGGNGYTLNIAGGISAGSGILMFNPTTANVSVGGAITTGTGSLAKNGSGALTLNGVSTYTGGTTINAGTLAISSTGEIYNTGGGSYVVTVNGGATLSVYSWAWASVGSIGATYIGAGNLVVNGGTITYTGIGENAGVNNGRNFTIGTGGATLNAAGTGTWHITLDPGYTQTIGGGLALTLTGSSNGQIDNQLNGAGSLVKSGAGTWTLTCTTNSYAGGTAVNGGTLLVNNTSGTGTGTNAVNINSGGTLGGTGVIAGAVTNNAGGILLPGTNGIGTLTVSNYLTLLSGSTNTFAVNGTTLANTKVVLAAPATVTYGGVLNIAPTGTFTNGQTFTLFSGTGATNTSNFNLPIVGSPGAGKAFSFTNGVLSVVGTGPSGPATLTNLVSGSTLSLSWPAGQGWRLQMQTNSLSVGLNTNWIYLTDGTLTSTNITIDSSKPTVFYRLTSP